MKIYNFTIIPKSTFLTPPKGDILYGQIIKYLCDTGKTIDKDEFIISDFLPYGYFLRPNFPLEFFGDVDKKELRKQKFINLENLLNKKLQPSKVYFGDKEVVIKNSLNRVSFMTGEGFDPYSLIEISYPKMWGFIAVNEDKKDTIFNGLKKVGEFGFGKKSTIGKGQFEVSDIKEFEFSEGDYYMNISPVILDEEDEVVFYEPYVKFGKYGLNSKENVFKQPVIYVDSGSIFKTSKFAGQNREMKDYFIQGKSILVPIKVKP